MPFCLFQTAFENEIDILNEVGGDPAAIRLFQTGLRVLLPVMMRGKCVMTPPTANDPNELAELRSVLDLLLSEGREARPHEKKLAREAIATAASQFANKDYTESVFLWLLIQGYAEEKAIGQESDKTNQKQFFR